MLIAITTKPAVAIEAIKKYLCWDRLLQRPLDAPRSYAINTYEKYIERRNCLIDELNKLPGVYSPIPMEHSTQLPACPSMTAISSASGVSLILSMKERPL